MREKVLPSLSVKRPDRDWICISLSRVLSVNPHYGIQMHTVLNSCNPSILEAETGEIQGHPWLCIYLMKSYTYLKIQF